MDLYKINSKKINLLNKKSFELEKNIQKIIETNLKEIFDITFIASEFTVGKYSIDKLGRIDTLAFDEKNKSFVIIEYKNSESRSVIDQGFSYLSELVDRGSDFMEKLNEVRKDKITKKEVDWTQSKVIFVSPAYTSYQINGSNFKDLPIELWKIQLFEEDLFSLEQIIATSNQSINKISKNKAIQDVTKVVHIVNEEVHITKTNEICKGLWSEIREKYLKYGDTSINVKKDYVAIKKNNTTIFYVRFNKVNLKIDMIAGYSKNNIKVKNYLEFNDEKKFGKLKKLKHTDSYYEHIYTFNLHKKDEFNYAIYLMDQKYLHLEK